MHQARREQTPRRGWGVLLEHAHRPTGEEGDGQELALVLPASATPARLTDAGEARVAKAPGAVSGAGPSALASFLYDFLNFSDVTFRFQRRSIS